MKITQKEIEKITNKFASICKEGKKLLEIYNTHYSKGFKLNSIDSLKKLVKRFGLSNYETGVLLHSLLYLVSDTAAHKFDLALIWRLTDTETQLKKFYSIAKYSKLFK